MESPRTRNGYIHSDLHMPGGQDFPSSHSILEAARTSYILSSNTLTVEVKLKSKEIKNAFFLFTITSFFNLKNISFYYY